MSVVSDVLAQGFRADIWTCEFACHALIHTCRLCDVNPFEYLTELGNHADELPQDPQHWMPWSHRSDHAAPAAASH